LAAFLGGVRNRESQFFPKKLHHEITDERRNDCDGKIDFGKNIMESPSQACGAKHAGAGKFPHQEVGIKEEDYEAHLG